MADVLKGLVYQSSYQQRGDGVQAEARMSRRGELIVPEWYMQLAIEGRVFEVSNATKGTAAYTLGGTSYGDTVPAFLIDVPSGYTVIPLEILMKQAGTVAGDLIYVLLTVDNKLRYSSGGTVMTVRANRTDAPVASACSAYNGISAITAAAAALQRTFWASLMSPDVSPTADVGFPGYDNCVEWTAKKFVPPVLVGPASLVIYAYAGTRAPSWLYTIKWAEFATAQAT